MTDETQEIGIGRLVGKRIMVSALLDKDQARDIEKLMERRRTGLSQLMREATDLLLFRAARLEEQSNSEPDR